MNCKGDLGGDDVLGGIPVLPGEDDDLPPKDFTLPGMETATVHLDNYSHRSGERGGGKWYPQRRIQ